MEISKQFESNQREDYWYSYWLSQGYFKSTPDHREPYTIVIPPPNVTGVLHMGHMLNNTIQDVLVRRARMQSKNACWVPGTDHASIATEAKVVALLREKGIKKREIGRAAFLDHAWEWKEKYGGIILEQLKKLGASCDWDRTRFTMEPDLSLAVQEVFVRLHEQGLIYRGLRMVNWDPVGRTALSDEEVIHKEVSGILYYLKYEGETPGSYIVVATSRPETIFADVAVCVNPQDDRYTNWIGKKVRVPLTDVWVPIIADDYVSADFGTGCLKVTPAHDPNDYALGQRHGLTAPDVFTETGLLTELAGRFAGMDRFEARKAVAQTADSQGLLVKTEEYAQQLGHSERTQAVIEPRLSLQWFVNMQAFMQKYPQVLDAVMQDEIQFHPAKFKNTYRHWIENIKDWCISRQLWWGQRIPAWYDEHGNAVVALTESEAKEKMAALNPSFSQLNQDEDVLDTWFSSWLWPISVFDGFKSPGNPEISYYYPTNDLVTAPEIMFFWVARMVMAGYAFQGKAPFKNVYFTGIVRDDQRRKMSKSLGNSPDPLALIRVHGADGVRVGMLLSAPAGNDLLFNENLCQQGRNFTHKLWNAYRLVVHWKQQQQDSELSIDPLETERLSLAEAWMSERLQEVSAKLNQQFEQFRISEALMTVYKLTWDDFCSWYLEMVKPAFGFRLSEAGLEAATARLEQLCALLHPFIPFITEEIWQGLRHRAHGKSLMVELLPQAAHSFNLEFLAKMELMFEVITQVRAVRQQQGIPMKDPLTLFVSGTEHIHWDSNLESILRHLAHVSFVNTQDPAPREVFSFQVKQWTCSIPAGGYMDAAAEIERIEKEKTYLEGFVESVRKKLSNERFVANAKPEVVAIERQKEADALFKIESLTRQLLEWAKGSAEKS